MANRQRFDIEIGAQVDPSVRKAASNAQSILGSIVGGNLISSGIQAAIGGIQSMASGALDTYREYQKSMANTAGIAGITDKSSADFQKLSEAAEAAGEATAFTSAQAGDALGYMALAGWDADKSTSALMPTLKLAEATGADLATTADLVTNSMNAMGVSFDDLDGYFDVIIKANNKSATTAGELMEAFTGVGGAAKAAGQDYKTTSTALGILANAGTKGAEAGTALNSILVRMTSKQEAMNAYKKLGVSIYDAAGNTRNFGDILKDTSKAMEGMTEEQKNSYLSAIAGTNYYSTYNQLLEGVNKTVDGGASAWDKLSGEIQNSNNALDTMHKTTTDTVDYAFSLLDSALQNVQLQFLKAFGPEIQSAVQYVAGEVLPKVANAAENLGNFIQDPVIVKFKEFKNWVGDVGNKISEFNSFLSEHQEILVAAAWAVGGLTTALLIYNGAAILASVQSGIETGMIIAMYTAEFVAAVATTALGAAFNFLTSPITILILLFAGLMAATYLVYKNWDKIKVKADELWQKILEFGAGLRECWNGIIEDVNINLVQPWNNFWDAVGGKVSAVWQGIKNAVKSGINSVINFINSGIGQLNKFQVNVPKGVPIVGGKHVGLNIPKIPTLATGGIATGPTLAEIGEGGEPEAVVPLTKLSNMLNGGVGGGITYSANIVINGNADKSEISEAMRSSYEEFKEFMDRYTSERRRLAF
nr:MAG TPA: minor tail protein [Caudoviricetes sp.]